MRSTLNRWIAVAVGCAVLCGIASSEINHNFYQTSHMDAANVKEPTGYGFVFPVPEWLTFVHYFLQFSSLSVEKDSLWKYLDSVAREPLENDVQNEVLYFWFNSYKPCIENLGFLSSEDQMLLENIAEEENSEEEQGMLLLQGKMIDFWRRNDQQKIFILEKLRKNDSTILRSFPFQSSCAYVLTFNASMQTGVTDEQIIQSILSQISILEIGTKILGVPDLEIELWLKKYSSLGNNYNSMFKLASFDLRPQLSECLLGCKGRSPGFTKSTCFSHALNLTDVETGVNILLTVQVSKALNELTMIPLTIFGIILTLSYTIAVVDTFAQSGKNRSFSTSAKYLLGNLLYLTFGGAFTYLLLLLLCLVFMLSIIGFPIGWQMLQISINWLCPFGRSLSSQSKVVDSTCGANLRHYCEQAAWFAIAGVLLCPMHLICAFISGALLMLPIAETHFQKGVEILYPLPADVKTINEHQNVYEELSDYKSRRRSSSNIDYSASTPKMYGF